MSIFIGQYSSTVAQVGIVCLAQQCSPPFKQNYCPESFRVSLKADGRPRVRYGTHKKNSGPSTDDPTEELNSSPVPLPACRL